MFEISSSDDVPGVIALSTRLFEDAGLNADVSGRLDASSADLLERAIAEGFREAIALPAASWQRQHVNALASAFATGGDWGDPYLDIDGMSPVGRPPGSYLLLLRVGPADDELRGLTAPALRKQLGQDASLTVEEYLVVQRTMLVRNGDHRFDDYLGEPSGWMWLADSTVGDRTAMAYWYGPKRRIEVTACRTGSKNPRKGARRSRVVPLT